MAFTVALVGRPNVGKSTLFNRLVGRKVALVDDRPGVTRDRREGEARLSDLRFRVFDTAGLEEAFDDSLEARMRRQTEIAVREADLVLFMIDARAGVMPLDETFASWLRRIGAKVALVANKAEGRAGEGGLLEAFSLGLGEPLALSAEHGDGLAGLYDILRKAGAGTERDAKAREAEKAETDIDLGEEVTEEEAASPAAIYAARPLRLAIVGRPNVGKSTLINRLIGQERLLTGPEAGITRDSISVDWDFNGRPVILFDTAGLRRRSRVEEKIEKLSAAETRRAIDFAEVVILLLDADQMLEKQDLTIARRAAEEGRAVVVAANKWDAVIDKPGQLAKLRDRVEFSLPQLKGVPVLTVSARDGRNLDRLIEEAFAIRDVWSKRISTSKLNDWLGYMTEAHPPPMVRGRRIRLKFMTQAKTRPPSFMISANMAEDLPDDYRRYLINGLREDFGLAGVPIRIMIRGKKNPFAEEKS